MHRALSGLLAALAVGCQQCSDGDAVTVDAGPSIAAGCASLRDGAACDDGDPLTSPDRCAAKRCKGEPVKLEIAQVFTDAEGSGRGRTSFLAQVEKTVAVAKVSSAELAPLISWKVRPLNPHSGPAVVETAKGPRLRFAGTSLLGHDGSRKPNEALEYEITAELTLGGKSLQAKLSPIRQVPQDVLRQEYLDSGTTFLPVLANVRAPAVSTLNTGNYEFIVEERRDALERLLGDIERHSNALLNNDRQVVPVGRAGLRPDATVVEPGPAILEVGPLGDTTPQGDDVCTRFNGTVCTGAIAAGPNGIANTRANNRNVRVNLDQFVSSAYRNPQRNRAAGSTSKNSRHIRGMALDIDPRTLNVAGRAPAELMCIIEQAGASAAQGGKSFTERGAATFLDCNDTRADHVHVQL